MLGSGYVAPFAEAAPNGGSPYDAGYIQSQNPAAWFRLGMGITVVTGVSQWSDQTANARHLLQATGANQPALQADGSILFDGVDDYLRCSTFTLTQPETVYILFKNVAWTLNGTVYDGFTDQTMRLLQASVSPQISLFAGSAVQPTDAGVSVGAYSVVASVFNGASSVIQTNSAAPVTGSPGTGIAAGLTLGARGGATQPGNIQVKEVILFAVPHDESVRAGVVRYLAGVGGIAV